MNKLNIPDFKNNNDLHKFLIENKETIIAQKMAAPKHADAFSYSVPIFDEKTQSFKQEEPSVLMAKDSMNVKVVINTTRLLDSHMDCHIDGLWKKSLQENRRILFLQEHDRTFDKIIADQNNLKAYTKNKSWVELGYAIEGNTQALIFEATVYKKRNSFMFEQYANGYVREHSVGMRYVKTVMAINDEAYGAEYEAWEKYYKFIVNPEMADKYGYFWAITEGKVIEGSAVVLGSNYITPTIEVKQQNEPSFNDTLKYLSQNFKL